MPFIIDGTGGGGPTYPDYPWVSEDPISGTIMPGECTVVDVTFDATGIYTPGDYLADLVIMSNDPVEPEITLPMTMTVLESVSILSVTHVITDLTVAFFPTVIGGEPIDYWWEFGDGMTSTEMMPVHVYPDTGCYTVTLDVANECGLDSWIGVVCVVAPCDPVHDADFTWMPMMPIVGEMVYFTGTATGTLPISYAWDFGDGTMGAGQYVMHTYTAANTYTVIMTATNDCGEDVVTYDIVVASGCVPPSGADFTYMPMAPETNQMVYFTATLAAGTEPLAYGWDFGDGGTGSGMNVTYTFVNTGTFTVTLTVTNACGMDEMAYAITVVAPPVEMFEIYLPIIVRPAIP
jgi:PKD repeat protein